MRPVSSALAEAQRHRDARARVTMTIEDQGQAPGVPRIEWGVHDVSLRADGAHAALARPDGSVWYFEQVGNKLTRARVADPSDPAQWANRSAVDLATIDGGAQAMGAGAYGARAAVAWVDDYGLNLGVYQEGAGWTFYVTDVTGLVAAAGLHVAWCESPGAWAVGCTRDVGSGEFAGVFLHDGVSWSSRSNVGHDAAWRCAGVVAHDEDGYRVVCLGEIDERALVTLWRPTATALEQVAVVERAPGGRLGWRWLWGQYVGLDSGCSCGPAGRSRPQRPAARRRPPRHLQR